jgi:VIT1/CCC1 family predicted Fe2+/Mn2+ transporter
VNEGVNMARGRDTERYLVNLKEERTSAFLYRALAEYEQNPKIAEVYRRLADVEEAHAALWARKLEEGGAAAPVFRPAARTRLLVRLARHFGTGAVLPALSSREVTASQDYGEQPEAAEMMATERSHARLLSQIGQTTRGGLGGSALAQIEGRHRMSGGNALRAAVLGASDGLLSNFNLVMGVAGAELSGRNILLTGCAGLLAGAISMALGEWISVQSSRELYQKQIRTEQEEIATMPEEEMEELALIYQARGIDEPTARLLATRIMGDREHALDTMAREELGVNPEDLGGSAWEAAFTSFALFAIGAVIPVIPFAFLAGTAAIVTSAVMSAAGLFLVGAAITLFTGRPVWYTGMRQVLFGLAAAAATFLLGRLVGMGLGG